MKEQRNEKLKKIINDSAEITGIVDGAYEERVRYTLGLIERDSSAAKELEKAGYVLIYPKISDLPRDGKGVNKYLNRNDAMIIDKVDKNPDVHTIYEIAKHYNKEDWRFGPALAEEDGSLTFEVDDDVKKIYDTIGITYNEKENGYINVVSTEKRKEVSKGKIAQIYEKAKGKLKGTVNRFKNFFKTKEEKSIDQESNLR